ncbi:Spy0128 family protein [Bifidobacterium cuniculi]|uniref:Spy0128 family protein n=1 Tax=Bifidobacterium cuniculi TaxID=1688 RepID=UPI00068DD52C|nr:FctA domain-containing protein [Bifidobacterium cuniculi]
MQTDAGGPGWSVDDGPTRSVTVESGSKATLEYVNRYTYAPVTLGDPSVSGTKTLEGRDWLDDDEFTFTISAGVANPAPALPAQTAVTLRGQYDEDKAVPFSFGDITFTVPGTYRYVIEESAGAVRPGIRYSGARYVLTVVVEDDGQGALRIADTVLTNTFDHNGDHIEGEPSVDGGAVFVNSFIGKNEAFADITGTKRYVDVTGTNPIDRVGKFQVRVSADKDNPVPGPALGADGEAIVNIGLDGTWNRNLAFDDTMLNHQKEQRFTYHVSEVVPDGVTADNPTLDGMTYDLTTYTVVVTLKLDADGNLVTTVEYPDGGDQVQFENRYEAAPATIAPLKVTKTVSGASAQAGKFTFEATLEGDADAVHIGGTPWSDPVTAATPAIEQGAAGHVDFGNVTFTKPGTYRFTIAERVPQTAAGAPGSLQPTVEGWTYDTHRHIVTVVVADTGGKLVATVTSDEATAAFENSYAVTSLQYGDVGTLRISKTLTGRSLRAGEFAFAITPIDDAPLPDGTATTENPYASADGQALVWPVNGTLLADLTFTQQDADRTYCYRISETIPKAATPGPNNTLVYDGVTYDTSMHTVCLAVSDTGKGTLAVRTTVDGADATVAAFTNRYEIEPTPQSVTFTKTLTGRDWKEDETFTFTLAAEEAASSVSAETLEAAMPQTREVAVGKGNAVDFGFGDFVFSQAGVYVYTVTEHNAGKTVDGLSHAKPARLTFSVVDNGRGQYSVGQTISGIEGSTFVNRYTPAPVQVDTPGQLHKELRADAWDDGLDFGFKLTDISTNENGETIPAPLPLRDPDDSACDTEARTCTVRVGKPQDGMIAPIDFGTFTFDHAGTYTYEITEIDESSSHGGIYYDTHAATLVITVSDDGEGRLAADVQVTDGAFVNTVGVELPSTGGRLEQGMIMFALAMVCLVGAALCAAGMNRLPSGPGRTRLG